VSGGLAQTLPEHPFVDDQSSIRSDTFPRRQDNVGSRLPLASDRLLHAALLGKGADLLGALTSLSKETGWRMGDLLADRSIRETENQEIRRGLQAPRRGP
jgi:hypothetical protein